MVIDNPQKFDKIIKDIISTIEDMVLHNELSEVTEDNNKSLLVSAKQIADYMDLSINIAATIIAHAMGQVYRNKLESLNYEQIYDKVLNVFEDILKQQLAIVTSTIDIDVTIKKQK